MKHVIGLLVLALSAGLHGVAQAHPDHDEVEVVAMYKVELVKKKDGASFLISKDGTKVSTVGATGKLILKKGNAKTEVALQPDGKGGMETAKPIKIAAGAQVRAMITFADATAATEDFVVK
ncbi:MAG: hypothetical protein V4633_08780 [Pseudomonadota bacterium]